MDRQRSIGLVVLILLVTFFGWSGFAYWLVGDMLISNPLFVLTIFFAIAWHEFWHFAFARIAKIGVQEYAIGVGPKLFSVRIGETRFTFRAILIGGYVDTADWNDVECEQSLSALRADEQRMVKDHRRWFSAAPLRARLTMVAAGPLSNILLGAAIFAVVGAAYPVESWWAYIAAVWDVDVRSAIYGIPGYEPRFRFAFLHGINEAMVVHGWTGVLRHFAVLNLALGLLNALPIPPLDGGVIIREVVHEGLWGHLPIQERVPKLKLLSNVWGVIAFVGLIVVIGIQLM